MPNTGVIAACPFYITHSSGKQWQNTITCEDIRNMGFSMRNQLRFIDQAEQESYLDMFCSSGYEDCPYYQAIYIKYGQKDKKPKKQIPEPEAKPKPQKRVNKKHPVLSYQQISLFDFINLGWDREGRDRK